MKRLHLAMLSLGVAGLSVAAAALMDAPAKRKTKAKKTAPAVHVTEAQRNAARAEIARRVEAAGSSFENPEELEPFFEALPKNQTVHILQFGDSHTASDDWVNSMRTILQAKIRRRGTGFYPGGQPVPGLPAV